MNKLREEFTNLFGGCISLGKDGSSLLVEGNYFKVDKMFDWINQNYISKEQIKCTCRYDDKGKRIATCFRCMKMIINANLKGRKLATKQILNLECLKEEDESGWKGNSFDNTGNGNKSIRNQLRNEIKEEIKKLK